MLPILRSHLGIYVVRPPCPPRVLAVLGACCGDIGWVRFFLVYIIICLKAGGNYPAPFSTGEKITQASLPFFCTQEESYPDVLIYLFQLRL